MNRTILDNLNAVVTEKDWLYYLGDMALTRNPGNLTYWLDGLRCKNICFIKGNHDQTAEQVKDRFFWYKDMAEIEVEGQRIVLCHYAMKVWHWQNHNTWQLYGHSHGSLADDPNLLSMDVGVDTNNFMPYSLEDLRKIMSKKTFIPLDHHR